MVRVWRCNDAFVFVNRKDLCIQLTVETHVELQLAFLRGFQSYDDDIICLRSKDGTHILHAVHLVGSGIQRIAEVQFTTVVNRLRVAVVVELEFQAAQRQEAHAVRAAEEVLIQQLVSLLFTTHQRQVAHLLQVFTGFRAIIVVRGTAPEGFLVELDFFLLDATINHCPQMGIAYGQRFQPFLGGLVVP